MAQYFTKKSAALIEKLAVPASTCSIIDNEYYKKYDVKKGLRDVSGKGVVCGLTEISEIIASRTVDGVSQPCQGELYYRAAAITSRSWWRDT